MSLLDMLLVLSKAVKNPDMPFTVCTKDGHVHENLRLLHFKNTWHASGDHELWMVFEPKDSPRVFMGEYVLEVSSHA